MHPKGMHYEQRVGDMYRVQRQARCSAFLASLLTMAWTAGALAETAPSKDGAFAFGKARIEFRKSNVVRGDNYTLGDIASIKTVDAARERRLACLVLGRSPALGNRIMLNPRFLELSLDRLGVTDEASLDFPDRIYIQRDVQNLDMETLRRTIEKEVRDQLPFQGEIVVIERIQLPKSLRLPTGTVSYKTDFRLPRRGVGAVSFQVEILVDGASKERISGSLYTDMMVPVLKAERAVARGELVRADACKETTIRLSEVRGNPVRTEDLPKALRTKRDLMPGDLVTWYNVEREILVQRGQTVRLVLQSAGIRISTLGRVSSQGALGDLVEVVNAKSGKKLQGYVVDRQTIRVPF